LPVREGDPSAADDESVRSWEAGFDADGAGGCGDGVLCGEGTLFTLVLAEISTSTEETGGGVGTDMCMGSKTPKAAREFYTAKVEELGKNLQELEGIVQQKNGQLRVVEDGEFGILSLPRCVMGWEC